MKKVVLGKVSLGIVSLEELKSFNKITFIGAKCGDEKLIATPNIIEGVSFINKFGDIYYQALSMPALIELIMGDRYTSVYSFDSVEEWIDWFIED